MRKNMLTLCLAAAMLSALPPSSPTSPSRRIPASSRSRPIPPPSALMNPAWPLSSAARSRALKTTRPPSTRRKPLWNSPGSKPTAAASKSGFATVLTGWSIWPFICLTINGHMRNHYWQPTGCELLNLRLRRKEPGAFHKVPDRLKSAPGRPAAPPLSRLRKRTVS